MPFPLIKLGYLVIKQLSKPLANAIKQKAKTTPFLRDRILEPPAQMYHKFETTIKMRLLGLGKVSQVKPLSDEMAVALAADMLGEAVIFSMASFCLWLEYKRQQRKDVTKEDVQNQRLLGLEKEVAEMSLQFEEQSARLKELTRLLSTGKHFNMELASMDELPEKLVDSKSKMILHVKK